MVELNRSSHSSKSVQSGMAALAAKVIASEAAWDAFQADPNAYATQQGFSVTFDDVAVSKIKSTSYADAQAKLPSIDLMTQQSRLW